MPRPDAAADADGRVHSCAFFFGGVPSCRPICPINTRPTNASTTCSLGRSFANICEHDEMHDEHAAEQPRAAGVTPHV